MARAAALRHTAAPERASAVSAGVTWAVLGSFGLLWQLEPGLWLLSPSTSFYRVMGVLYVCGGLSESAFMALGGRGAVGVFRYGSGLVTTLGGLALAALALVQRDQALLLAGLLGIDGVLRCLEPGPSPVRFSGLFAVFAGLLIVATHPLSTIYGALAGAVDAFLRGASLVAWTLATPPQGESSRGGPSHSTRASSP